MAIKGPFSKAFQLARYASGWEQQMFATAMGLHRQLLSQIESGRASPPSADHIKIACGLMKIPEQTRYFQLLAEWDIFMRAMPYGAKFGRDTLEVIGELYAREKLDIETWDELNAAVTEVSETWEDPDES